MTEKILVISTAHLPGNSLDSSDFGIHRWVPHYYGYIIFLAVEDNPEELDLMQEETPTWLWPIIELALNEGCSYINFDADSDIHPELEILTPPKEVSDERG